MNITSLVYSPTGATARVARALTSVWKQVHYTQIDLTKDAYPYEALSFGEKDVCYICFPSCDGRVPEKMLERLSRMNARETPAVIVVIYENQPIGGALQKMKTETATMGFCPIAAVEAVSEHTVFPHRRSNRPDEWDLSELEQFGEIIRSRIMSGDKCEISVPEMRGQNVRFDVKSTKKKMERTIARMFEGRKSNNLYL